MSTQEKIEWLEYEERMIRDYEFDPALEEYCYLRDRGETEAMEKLGEKMAAIHYRIENIEKNIRLIREGAEERTDKDKIQRHCDIYNEYRKEYECGLHMQTEFEDYGIDLCDTGFTEEDKFFAIPYEDKVLSEKYTYDYLENRAGRNKKCRYCPSADTVEELEADTTPMPEEFNENAQILALNSTDKYGKLNGKWHKLIEANAGLLVELKAEGGEILVFTPKALKRAFLGYYWIECEHTTEFNDRTVGWERKAAVDLRRYSIKIPREFVERYDKRGNKRI